MKAAVYRKYGPPHVVAIENVEKPVPKSTEVLIKIHAATVASGDWRVRSLEVPPGFGPIIRLVLGVLGPRKPILGTELAGTIESVGKNVTQFKVGDQVFAYPGFGMGCHAEYRTMPADGNIGLKPVNLSFAEAAAISFGGTTALHFLRDLGRIRSGEKVLIIGASGSVGSAAVQLARHFGAHVTGVCSAANLELVTSLGADRVIDYARENFAKSGETYDIIFDTVGEATFRSCNNALREQGRLLLPVAGLPQMLGATWRSPLGKKKIITGNAKESREAMLFLKELIEAGRFRPVIDQCFPLGRIVEAHARVDSRRKRGNVVITISP